MLGTTVDAQPFNEPNGCSLAALTGPQRQGVDDNPISATVKNWVRSAKCTIGIIILIIG
jgi:hypothetical protein